MVYLNSLLVKKEFMIRFKDIELKGFIDRVDLYQNYLKVIDYKSSNKELNLELARLGFNMQMLIYLEMLSKIKTMIKALFCILIQRKEC